MKRILSLLGLLAVFFCTLAAQEQPRVWLVTCYPGNDIYELEGHSALRIQTPQGQDMAISYGMFDFNAPNFVYRFVKGETDYMAAAIPWSYFEAQYRREGRRVEQQPILLTPEQTERLIDAVAVNLRPENRVYRYNYVKDNCATRPLQAILIGVADSVKFSPTAWDIAPLPYSFRDVMRRYHANYPWYQFGIDLALGPGIDYPLEPRELAFAPTELEIMMSRATVDGRLLTGPVEVVIDFPADGCIANPTPWWCSPLAVCWVFLLITIGVVIADWRRRRISKWFDALYFGIEGLTGLLLTFLIFVSVHEATSPNWLYLWLNPLCFIPTIFIWKKTGRKVVYFYQIINFVVVIGLMACYPLLPQSFNPAFWPLILADVLLAIRYIALYSKPKA